MKTKDIREAFISYFEGNGHTAVASSSLIPVGDPTLLFTNAGMVQFKDCFLGAEKRDYTRATTCQKCLRISGKHNDLENVGRTARHHTFFEMLGNFSFGDYFKKDAIIFGWEFITETLGLPKDRLWVTIFEDDDEAEKLWRENTDVIKDRILRFGEKDNFWAMGDTGPCGPCSEIFYYLGDDVKSQSKEEFYKDDGTYVEIWNLVFMQFNRDSNGTLTPLPKPAVDTGMGLERIAAVMQGVKANYDSDLLRGLIAVCEELSGKSYDGSDYRPEKLSKEQYETDVAMRVIADHARAASFLIADGINPSSDGRGYVLRRLIRRACRHARVLGFKDPFLKNVTNVVVDSMSATYPELEENRDRICNLISIEEEKFLATLDTGMQILNKEVSKLKDSEKKVLSGEVVFQLHDTYGFPLDLTEDLVGEHNLSVDTESFSAEMEKQRERSRQARSSKTELMLQRSVKPLNSKFFGYDFDEYESSVSGIFNADGEIKEAKAGDEIALISNETPFYAEAGGQIGDTGTISSSNASLDVIDTQKVGAGSIVHICRVVEGELSSAENIRLSIDSARRARLRLNHSATHLLHTALREVLGEEVQQAGSRVSDSSLRFDFTHAQSISASQITEVEDIVNELIRENHQVETNLMSIEEAKLSGATALFGEKYGSEVRVVEIGPRSKELCGGTHAKRSGDIGMFAVVHETSVSSGVRRVEGVCATAAMRHYQNCSESLDSIARLIKANRGDIEPRLEKIVSRERELERELQKFNQQINSSRGGDLLDQATENNGMKIVTSVLDEVTPGQLREIADDLRGRMNSGAVALASINDGKAIFLVALTNDLLDRFHAGELIKQIATEAGSKGGGKADLAQAGGGDPARIDNAIKRFEELIRA